MVDIRCDQDSGNADDPQVPPSLLAAEGLSHRTDEDEIKDVEVDAEEHHENADDYVRIGAVIEGNAGGFDAEAAGARRGEGVQDTVKNGHPA